LIMPKLKVLFFAADPYSLPPGSEPRLALDEDIRQIRETVRMSEYRDEVEVDLRLAARLKDILQALNEVQPDVVHFSGHGWNDGLIFMGPGGHGQQGVDLALLTKLFRTFRGNIRLVLLNACSSDAQATAIADVVGCAIGMRGKISDPAAIAFGAAFYGALGFSHSVQTAFDQGCIAIGSYPECESPQLAHRKDVDPANLVLVPPKPPQGAELSRPPARPKWKYRVIITVTLLALVGVVILRPKPAPECAWDRDGLPHLASDGPPPRVATSTSGGETGSGTELEIGKARQRAGDDTAAFRHFSKAAQAGNTEAMGYLGVAYLCGEGTSRRTTRGISWLREAAEKRDSRGMIAYAFAYQYGIGVKRNRGRMRFWYRAAADTTRSSEAMRRLGGAYADEEKWDSAVIWYRSAIRAGSIDAMVDLSSLYRNGPAGVRDTEQARVLNDSAARAGSVRAMAVGSALPGPRTAQGVAPPQDPAQGPDSAYRPPPLDDSGNLVQNGGFQNRFEAWTRSVDGGTGKGTNEIVPFADARSGYALHLTYEDRGSLLFVQKVSVSSPDYVFRGTFRASSHEGRMIGFSGTGIATVMLQYLDEDGRVLGVTGFYSYVENPLANTPLVGVPRRGNGGNNVHYIDVEKDRLYKDYELDIRREIEENLLAVVADQVRTIAITLYCGATDQGAGAELWVSDLSLRPKR
jgi:hypothetical protein